MQSATNLKINELIKFKTCDFKKILPETNTGTIIINPPYGKRIGEFLKLQKQDFLLGPPLNNMKIFIFHQQYLL